ncbi:hypothetical protein E2K80_04145 [Rhodophyticola sp. CCM32]|uniref:Zn-ribbon domain-containing OB-fold protein n=1 Tax=Rhodophyticola sp. CCM32 TaxID=2916397 RepID=UPI00107F5939|nr:OB-fold domain-containing protein [Rhodophyticola sp. CCM32]QBY00030.1 hypothetical protein E2K80_04145 [Rhodophyticola sp. CCM32]
MDAEGPERRFLEFLRKGQMMLQRDPQTGRAVFPPRLRGPCHGQGLEDWAPISGRGRIYAFTIEHPRAPAPPRALILVDLDEGGRLVSHMPDTSPDAVRIGAPVQARIVTPEDGDPHLVFDLEPAP